MCRRVRRENASILQDSSVHSTGMRSIKTVWCYRFLRGSLNWLSSLRKKMQPTRFFWMDLSVKNRYTVKHLWEGEIAFLVAVNRSYGKSDYIPAFCWDGNGRFASGFEVGSHVQIWGRIQSREYVKKVSETQGGESCLRGIRQQD